MLCRRGLEPSIRALSPLVFAVCRAPRLPLPHWSSRRILPEPLGVSSGIARTGQWLAQVLPARKCQGRFGPSEVSPLPSTPLGTVTKSGESAREEFLPEVNLVLDYRGVSFLPGGGNVRNNLGGMIHISSWKH